MDTSTSSRPSERDRAITRLRRLTLGIAIGSLAGTAGLSVVAAHSSAGSAGAEPSAAAVPTDAAGAEPSPSTSPTAIPAPTATATSVPGRGGGHVTSGGS